MTAALYVHLPPAVTDKARAAALAEDGLWHKVASFREKPGTEDRQEAREFTAECGLVQDDSPDRMEESETKPGGARCPDCFAAKAAPKEGE